MLNGSAANAHRNAATVSKVERYAPLWGYRTLLVSNLFAAMARHPADLATFPDPVGTDNDTAIIRATQEADTTICAWGEARHLPQSRSLCRHTAPQGHAATTSRLNASGQPAHPIYLPLKLTPQLWHSRLVSA